MNYYLPDEFFDGNVYIHVTSANVHDFVDLLKKEDVEYYYDIVNFVTKWDHTPDGYPACYWDLDEECVHINGTHMVGRKDHVDIEFEDLCKQPNQPNNMNFLDLL